MSGFLAWAMLIFVAAAFALPGAAAYGLVFYVVVLPSLVLGWRRIPRPGAADFWALALIAWSGLTLLWGDNAAHRDAKFLLATLATAVFFLALRATFADPRNSQGLATVLIAAGTANAAFVLLASCRTLLSGGRILGWGITRQPILGGSVIAVCMLTAFSRAIAARDAKGRAMNVAAAALMAWVVLALQSRGALLAAAGATFLLFAASPWRVPAMAGSLSAGCAWLLLAPTFLRESATRLLFSRGDSHRFAIWQRSLVMIRQKPLFGHGLAANLPPDSTGFPHSLYLSVLFYSGLIGLMLFLALAFLVTQRLLSATAKCPLPFFGGEGWARRRWDAQRAWVASLWLNALLAGITDFGQITKGPGELWLILWLPIALALSPPVTPPAAASAPRAPATR